MSTMATTAVAASGGTPLDYTFLTEYGLPGVFIAILIYLGLKVYRREIDRSAKIEAELKECRDRTLTEVLPLLASTSKALETTLEVLRREHGGRHT